VELHLRTVNCKITDWGSDSENESSPEDDSPTPRSRKRIRIAISEDEEEESEELAAHTQDTSAGPTRAAMEEDESEGGGSRLEESPPSFLSNPAEMDLDQDGLEEGEIDQL
jgi:hypothetical protein